jgi:hypothetical protein
MGILAAGAPPCHHSFSGIAKIAEVVSNSLAHPSDCAFIKVQKVTKTKPIPE